MLRTQLGPEILCREVVLENPKSSVSNSRVMSIEVTNVMSTPRLFPSRCLGREGPKFVRSGLLVSLFWCSRKGNLCKINCFVHDK